MSSKLETISAIDRPVLGDAIPLVVFRAFRHFSSDYVHELLGRSSAMVFQNGGRELGMEVGQSVMREDLGEYLGAVTDWVRDAKIGLLRLVESDNDKLVLALDECITCAGMENIGQRICHFEVGLVAGVVEAFAHRRVRAYETKCNANGEDTCEVTVELGTPKF